MPFMVMRRLSPSLSALRREDAHRAIGWVDELLELFEALLQD